MGEMLEYIQIYAPSVASPDEKDKSSKKAMELYQYLNNNKEGLLPYDKRGVKIPNPKDGILYKGMGIQESQNCTVITLRMKYRKMRWPVQLSEQQSFKQIALAVNKNCTSISREIRNHIAFRRTGWYRRSYNACFLRRDCPNSFLCASCTSPKKRRCSFCEKCNSNWHELNE